MIITLDFETYFDKEYSLKKMTTEEYIRDPRFKIHGLAIKVGSAPARWYRGDGDVPAAVWTEIDNGAVLAHHAQFDGLILSHHLDTRPKLWLDTLSMARIALPHNRHSLDALSKHFGLPGKMHANLTNVQGVRDPDANMLAGLGTMSCDDADKTFTIFQHIKDYIPKEEFLTIDTTIRMFTEPVLQLDQPKMRTYYDQVTKEKANALDELGVTTEELQSSEKFAAKLREFGVEPATKNGKHGPIYAFAKTDQFMRDILEDDDDRVATLAAARVGTKSTIDETRCERLLSMAGRGSLAVYLRYAGAHPTRWSGGDALNWQNFRRNERDGRPGEIRGSIIAPPGHKIVAADASQIECRILNWLAGQWDIVEKFRNKEDLYSDLASKFYGFQVSKATPKERGTGKQLELSCGYGAAGPSIVETAKRGTYGPPVYLTQDQGEQAKSLYRATHKRVVHMWYQTAEEVMNVLEQRRQMTWGPMEIADGAIWLPNGLPLWYTHFKLDENGERWTLIRGRWRRIWGSKLVQHVCEGLARTVVSEAMLRIRAAGYMPKNTTHDELWVVAPLDDTCVLEYTLDELRKTPTWAPGLPLDAEGAEGVRYSK